MEQLPEDVYRNIKYMSLEHPCAGVIKKAFGDYRKYWDNIIEMFEGDPTEALALSGQGNFCVLIFLHWQKVMTAKGIDVLKPKKKRVSLRWVMNSVYSYRCRPGAMRWRPSGLWSMSDL